MMITRLRSEVDLGHLAEFGIGDLLSKVAVRFVVLTGYVERQSLRAADDGIHIHVKWRVVRFHVLRLTGFVGVRVRTIRIEPRWGIGIPA